jgi:hypothetical protein
MFLVLLVLHDPDYLKELLAAWKALGVSGVTVMYSTGLGRITQGRGMRDDLPLIPSLQDFYEAHDDMSRTLFTVVPDQDVVQSLITAARKVIGNLEDPDTGLLLVLPVLEAHGLDKGGSYES